MNIDAVTINIPQNAYVTLSGTATTPLTINLPDNSYSHINYDNKGIITIATGKCAHLKSAYDSYDEVTYSLNSTAFLVDLKTYSYSRTKSFFYKVFNIIKKASEALELYTWVKTKFPEALHNKHVAEFIQFISRRSPPNL